MLWYFAKWTQEDHDGIFFLDTILQQKVFELWETMAKNEKIKIYEESFMGFSICKTPIKR